MAKSKQHLLELAEAQFTGYGLAVEGYKIKHVIESMGLTKKDWLKIRGKVKNYIPKYDFDHADEFFGI